MYRYVHHGFYDPLNIVVLFCPGKGEEYFGSSESESDEEQA
jgi:hypothetical protein